MNQEYSDFLARKAIIDPPTGIEYPGELPSVMFPHQRDIVRWALRRGRSALFAGTGLGKSLMELAWGDAVARHTGKPVILFAPLAVAAQMIREAAKFGIKATHCHGQADVRPGINVTNYQKIEHFDLSAFGGVILDECFSGLTEIDVIDQQNIVSKKHIKDVRVGDKIVNSAGIDVVSDVHRREVTYAVKVSFNGQSVISSPNHPFLTCRGWIGAQDLEPGDKIVSSREALRLVRGAIHGDEPATENETLLRYILLSEMADEPAGYIGKSTFSGSLREKGDKEIGLVCECKSQSFGGNCADNCTQSKFIAGSSSKDIPPIEREGARTFRAWGQWKWHDNSSIVNDECSFIRLGSGVCFVTGKTESRLSHLLQVRLSERRDQSSYRSGWALPHLAQGIGREEGFHGGFIRVDGIEVLKPSDPRLDGDRSPDGKLYFYDLGGTRHPSFSVNGALVHNSSILKSYNGHYRTKLIADCADIPFRLAATATPAPNDFMELGNHAEFLGVMSYTDMLATFFSHDGGDTAKWRLKGHGEEAFWRWMASWSVMLRKPSDLGYPNEGYDLPPLIQHQHTVGVEYKPSMETGLLFPMQAATMQERIAARRDSVSERVRMAADITPSDRQFVWWCNLNKESEHLAKAIKGAVEVRGSDSEAEKERKILAFLDGSIRVLVTKSSICGFGLNFQHCADTGFVGLNDSFEQVYQAIRRFWRFGQDKPVNAHFIAAETEGAIVANLKRKEADADRMADAMVRHMADLAAANIRGMTRDTMEYNPVAPMALPAWLQGRAA